MSSSNQTSVLKLYSGVMEDVLAGVREAFIDEGVDEHVLDDLKNMWEAKLLATKAVEPLSITEPQPPPLTVNIENHVQFPSNNHAKGVQYKSEPQDKHTVQEQQHIQQQGPQIFQQTQQQGKLRASSGSNAPQQQILRQYPGSSAGTSSQSSTAASQQDLGSRLVPIQLTVPPPQGAVNVEPKVFNIQVPASAIANNQLQQLLSSPIITATMALPQNVAATLLQQHITAAIQAQAVSGGPSSANSAQNVQLSGNIVNGRQQFQNASQVPSTVSQVDGNYDTSDEEDDEDAIEEDDEEEEEEDDEDDSEDKDDDENDGENGPEEDPLNSGDDVSEGDVQDLFETDNVIVCQYDKITRSRNKWKFYLKDGIMNLYGKDYVFQRANGEAEW